MAGKLRLEGNGGFYSGFESNLGLTGDVVWKLPAADGTADQVLATDGAGELSWGDVPYNKSQIIYLPDDVETDTTIPNFSFSNLVVGNRYRIDLSILFALAANDNVQVQISHGAVVVPILAGNGGTSGAVTNGFISHEFIATATSVSFISGSISAGSAIRGNSSITETWARITEVNNVDETTDFITP
jgi:hypothetical protein